MTLPPCRLCGSTHLEPLFEVRGSRLDRCGTCDFVQVRDQPSVEELRQIYAETYFARGGKYDNDDALRRENRRRLELVTGLGVARGARVLEVGCATGDYLVEAHEQHDIWGLDVSQHATDIARQRLPARADKIFTGFIEDQSFAPASFDAIVMWDVIEHLWDPAAVCAQLVRYLRPGGSLVLSTPDIGSITARAMRSRWAFMTPPEHLSFFNDRSLRYLLQDKLGMRTTSSAASGKWANLGFLAYKLRRVFPILPQAVVQTIQDSPLGRTILYVPTGDVRYVASQKPLS